MTALYRLTKNVREEGRCNRLRRRSANRARDGNRKRMITRRRNAEQLPELADFLQIGLDRIETAQAHAERTLQRIGFHCFDKCDG